MISKNNEAVKLKYIRAGNLRNDAKAWQFQFEAKHSPDMHWIPTSCIQAFDPNSRHVTIETWILKKKNINYNV